MNTMESGYRETPPCKKMKNSQKFKEAYSREFQCLRASKISENMAFCITCSKDFSISHGGRDDCRRHVISKKHGDYTKAAEKTKNLCSFFKSDESLSTIKAESLFVRFLIEHNLPISVADHAKPLFAEMFPDSKIAKDFASGRTKSTAIIKTMAKNTTEDVVSSLSSPFAISIDGSNDSTDHKLYPLLTTYFDKERGEIVTMLLALLSCTDNTGEGIFSAISSKFEEKCLLWKNCVAFGSDNASTMIGKHKGVSAFILKQNESTIIRGCPCHLIHIAAKKAASKFNHVIDVELLLVDIYFFLDKSSKRKNRFKLCQKQCDMGEQYHKILKYASTRWLSLSDCLERILEQWEPLKLFFCDSDNSEDAHNKRFKNIGTCLRNDGTKLSILFLNSVLPLFTKVNTILQQDAPYVHKLQGILHQLFMDLLVRFVLPSAISKHKPEEDLFGINFKRRKHQKDDESLVIGVKTRVFLQSSNLSQEDISVFYSCVRDFYVAACTYIIDKLPIKDIFLKHAEIVDIEKRAKASFSSIMYMVQLFPTMFNNSELEKLEVEFAHYQADNLSDVLEISRIDLAWVRISELKDVNGSFKYEMLPKLMLNILVIPHSNAANERIFSIVRKNQTDFRPNLGIDTLQALLIEKVKMNVQNAKCFEKKFSDKELRSYKSATTSALAIFNS